MFAYHFAYHAYQFFSHQSPELMLRCLQPILLVSVGMGCHVSHFTRVQSSALAVTLSLPFDAPDMDSAPSPFIFGLGPSQLRPLSFLVSAPSLGAQLGIWKSGINCSAYKGFPSAYKDLGTIKGRGGAGRGGGLKEDIVIRLSKGGCVSLQTEGLQKS